MAEPREKESFADQLSRLRGMVEDDGETWDLSDNDQAAICAVLERLQSLEAAIRELHAGAKRVEESEAEDSHMMWLWRGKAIAYETVLGAMPKSALTSAPASPSTETQE